MHYCWYKENKHDWLQCKISNTILYCENWGKTVEFYKDLLEFPVNFTTDWFVEFSLNDKARLSIADERHTSVKSSHGKGITISLEIDDIQQAFEGINNLGLNPTAIKKHPWNAETFNLLDPEGNRLEFWQTVLG